MRSPKKQLLLKTMYEMMSVVCRKKDLTETSGSKTIMVIPTL
jgi:hypothetical protein